MWLVTSEVKTRDTSGAWIYTVSCVRSGTMECRTLAYSSQGYCLYGVTGAFGVNVSMMYQLQPLVPADSALHSTAVRALSLRLASMDWPEAQEFLETVEKGYVAGPWGPQ